MKLLCYGATVTAQKFDSEYFQYLCKSLLTSIFNRIENCDTFYSFTLPIKNYARIYEF